MASTNGVDPPNHRIDESILLRRLDVLEPLPPLRYGTAPEYARPLDDLEVEAATAAAPVAGLATVGVMAAVAATAVVAVAVMVAVVANWVQQAAGR